MGHVHHTVNKKVHIAHGHIRDFDESDRKHKMAFLTGIAVLLIIIYFWFNFLRFDQLVKSLFSGQDTLKAFIGVLPHLLVLALLGTPIVRLVLRAVKMMPFYVPRHKRREVGYKKYRVIRLKRFAAYYLVSLIIFVLAMLFVYSF